MYTTKRRIYLYFDKTQKSMLCTFLRSFVKKIFELDTNEILDKFLEEEEYYFKINASRFEFIENYLSDEVFLNETLEFIDACKKYYLYKKSQAPLVARQKQYDKEKRKFLRELKMSKELPTKKQLYYYDKLCKRYNIDKMDVDKLSKLDLRNELDRILNEYSRNCFDADK